MAFAETAEHGGFAAAAGEQGVAPSILAKAVSSHEEELGVKVFYRSTRLVTLAPDAGVARCSTTAWRSTD